MDDIKKDNTEQKILEAANEVFIQKGMDGARMQEIADTAGINKALLHYYFRTKQKLFDAIFAKAFASAFPRISKIMLSDISIREKLSKFIDSYIDLLSKNPFLPTFILKEINRDPEALANIIRNAGVDPSVILGILEDEMDKGNLKQMDPRELVINVIALSVFPFAGKPLLTAILYDGDKKAFAAFLKNRKSTLQEFIFNSILLK